MAISLENDFNVFLFPEGTSSSGETVLPFKANFFQLAIDCQTLVKPLVIKYVGSNSLQIPWYGSMTFAGHLYRICQLEEISVSLLELPEISGSDYTCKFELASKLHSVIRDQYERH